MICNDAEHVHRVQAYSTRGSSHNDTLGTGPQESYTQSTSGVKTPRVKQMVIGSFENSFHSTLRGN